jgi:hypothetical protein
MKKLFTMLTLLMFGLASITQVNASTLQDTTHKTKSGKLDRRYNANKHLKKDGSMDMRYKSSKTTVKKTTKVKKDSTKY